MRYVERLTCLVLLGLLGLFLAGGCGGQRDEWAGVVSPQELERASLRYYWRYKLLLPRGEKVVQAWRVGENLYALTSRHNLVAMDAVRGTYKWTVEVADLSQKVFPPCHAEGVRIPKVGGIKPLLDPPALDETITFDAVVINTLSHALVIDRNAGKVMRKWPLTFAANTGGSSDGEHIYLGAVNGRYYAVRLADGLNQWQMGTGDLISATPRFFSRRLYVASQDGKFYAIEPWRETDRHLWTLETDAALTADFAVDARGCFVPSQDYKVYAYDGMTGAELWTFTTQGSLREPVQVGQRTVFQYAHDDRFYAIDLARGKQRWGMKQGRTVLAAIDPCVFVLTADEKLLAIHEALGEVQTSLPTTGLDLFVPNAEKPVIYAASHDGKFVCITPKATELLTAEDLK